MSEEGPRSKGDSGNGAPEEDATVVRSQASLPARTLLYPDALGEAATQVRSLATPLFPPDPSSSAPRSGSVSTAPGQTLAGRYTVLNPLGQGGMGEVVAAYDSRLDRRVALKLLRRDWDPGLSQHDLETRMLREAQAMARLSHPHVVAIYDVGTLEDGSIFIAMEMVEGQTLRRWSEQAPRTWRETLDMYLAAGRGLAAAHEAGLVHRDFKPENVLVGRDGRVRVTDFGLARAGSAPEAPASNTPLPLPPGALDSPLTLQGTLLGTPRYMAPELLRAGPADARSDLFAFCVALYEALYRQHPFSGANQAESTQAQLEGRVKPPPANTDVPAWVADTLVQGLRADPAQRPASMQKLVAALEVDLDARRRARRRVVALTALVASLAGVTLWSVWQNVEQEPGCASVERRLTGTWDETVKARMKRAFLGTRLPYAQDTFTRVSSLLDGYAGTWVRMRTEACEALREPSPGNLAVRKVDCLERRHGQLRELTELFAREPDKDNLSKAVQVVQSLPSLSACADAKALTATVPLPEEPAVRAEVEALRMQVDRLTTLRLAGRYREARALGEELLPRVEKVGYGPLLAQNLYEVAFLKDLDGGDYAGAETLVRRAIPVAAKSKDLVMLAKAWGLLFREVGWRQARYQEAEGLTLAMESAMEVADDDETRSDALNDQAIVFQEMGRYEEARALYERVLEVRRKVLEPKHPKVIIALNNLGVALGALGRYEEARTMYQQALDLRREMLGQDNPLVANSYSNLGTALGQLGRHGEALKLYEHALAIRKKALGLEHPDVATSLNNYGFALNALGRYEEALSQLERALALREKLLKPEHPDTANTLNNLGSTLRGLGRYEEARRRFERALALHEKVLGADHPDVASTLNDLGEVLRLMKKPGEARARHQRALAIQEKALEPGHPDLAISLTGLGNVARDLGKYDEARTRYEQALALREKALGPRHPLVAESRDALARTQERARPGSTRQKGGKTILAVPVP